MKKNVNKNNYPNGYQNGNSSFTETSEKVFSCLKMLRKWLLLLYGQYLCNISAFAKSRSSLTIDSATALDVDDGEEQVDEWIRLDDWGKVTNVLRFEGSVDFICVELTTGDATSSNFDVTMTLLMCVSDISSSPPLASTFFWLLLKSFAVLSTISLLFSCELVIVLRLLLHRAVEKLLVAVDSLDVISWSCNDGSVLMISTGVNTRIC